MSSTPVKTPDKTFKTAEGGQGSSTSGEKLEGYVHNLVKSPVRSTFTLQGKRSCARVVVFSPEKVAKLENGESVQISNFKVSKTTEDILINNASKIENTECKFDKLNLSKLTLSMVQMIAVGDTYSFTATVKELQSPKVVKNLRLQNIAVSDATGTIKLTLWEDNVGKVVKGKTYDFTNFRLKEDKFGSRYFNSCKDNSSMITEAKKLTTPLSPQNVQLTEGTVVVGEFILLTHYESFLKCQQCKKKVVDNGKALIPCGNCGAINKRTVVEEQVYARMVFRVKESSRDITFTLFEDVLKKHVSKLTKDEIANIMMSFTEVKLVYNEKNVVVDIISAK